MGPEDAVLDGSFLLRAFAVSVCRKTSREHPGNILQREKKCLVLFNVLLLVR